MRKRNSYSRIVQDMYAWRDHQKGVRIRLFHHCIENNITSFYLRLDEAEDLNKKLGTALSESGLSRDKIQLIGRLEKENISEQEVIDGVENLLIRLRSDYLDLLLIDLKKASEEIFSALDQLKSRGQIVETGSLNGKTSGEYPLSANLWELEIEKGKPDSTKLGELTSEEVTEFLFLKKLYLPDLSQYSSKYSLKPIELILSWLANHPAQFHLISEGKNEEEIDLFSNACKKQLIAQDVEKISENIRINISNE